MPMEITDLKLSHLKEVVDLHSLAFPDFNITLMGRPFIWAYYLTGILSPTGLGTVAMKEGRVIAFISGNVESATFLWRVFFQSPFAFILGVLRICTIKPKMILEYIKKACRYFLITINHFLRIIPKKFQSIKNLSPRKGYISSMAVIPGERGSGASILINEHLLEQMRARGIEEVHTSIDENNVPANRFFRKMEFEFVESYQTERNRVTNKYVYRL